MYSPPHICILQWKTRRKYRLLVPPWRIPRQRCLDCSNSVVKWRRRQQWSSWRRRYEIYDTVSTKPVYVSIYLPLCTFDEIILYGRMVCRCMQDVVREYGKIAVDGAAARAALLEEVNMLRMQNLSARRGMNDVISSHYQHQQWQQHKVETPALTASSTSRNGQSLRLQRGASFGINADDSEDKIKSMERELKIKKQSEAKLLEMVNSLSDKLTSLKQHLDSRPSQEEFKKMEEVLEKKQEICDKWKQAYNEMAEEDEQLRNRTEEQDNYIEDLENRLGKVQEKYKAAKKNLEKLRSEKDQMKKEKATESGKVDSLRDLLLDIQKQLKSQPLIENIQETLKSLVHKSQVRCVEHFST